jgi:hypothetical protein
MAKRIPINRIAVQDFLNNYKKKHDLNNMALERLTGISNATISNLCYAKQNAVTIPVYDRLFSFIPLDVLDIPRKGQVTLEEVQRAKLEGFHTCYTTEEPTRKHSTESVGPAFAVEGREIFKDPITDDGTKKSATGLLSVIYDDNNEYKLVDKVDWATTNEGALQTIYKNGKQYNVTTLEEIRKNLK